jgi:phosphatidylglycerophosphate synthase
LSGRDAAAKLDRVQRVDLAEIRERTYKKRDAWWTVLVVDPLASRLVRLVAPYRWITPNRLTLVATVLGVAAAVSFGRPGRGALIAGALLFHASFVVDCMDGKIARLNGTGSMFGAWFDFMFDRLRVVLCGITLFGSQFHRTGAELYLWLAYGVIAADLFRYLNSAQMAAIQATMRARLCEARGIPDEPPDEDDDVPGTGAYFTARRWLRRRRIRMHLISGIEFEMFVFIIGPLTGWVAGVTVVSGALLLIMEAGLVGKLWLATRRHPAEVAEAQRLTPLRR